jgi:hypothetical protein
MTDEEKFLAYSKLTKSEIIRMHIELEKMARMMDGRNEDNLNTGTVTYRGYPFTYTDKTETIHRDTSTYSIS